MTEVVVSPSAPTPPFSYTDDQRKAIECIDGNLQIIACAGSGKTQVISERVAYLLERQRDAGLRPANIVAFTFTDRAAASLKDRIAQRIRARIGDIPGLAEMYVGTIHGYCLNLLQRRVPKYFKYQVLTDVQTRLFVDLGLTRFDGQPRYGAVPRSGGPHAASRAPEVHSGIQSRGGRARPQFGQDSGPGVA